MNELGYALLVGDGQGALSEALGEAIPVVRCAGASAIECPVMHGEVCKVRDDAKLTVVFVPSDEDQQQRLACVGTSDSRVVVVIEESDLPARVFGRFAVVGSQRGALGVLAAVSGVVGLSPMRGAVHCSQRST